MSQKKFVPKVNGCGEHIVVANMAIKWALSIKKGLYIRALNIRNSFGSVSHVQLEIT
jgi:hypothetical protein